MPPPPRIPLEHRLAAGVPVINDDAGSLISVRAAVRTLRRLCVISDKGSLCGGGKGESRGGKERRIYIEEGREGK